MRRLRSPEAADKYFTVDDVKGTSTLRGKLMILFAIAASIR